MDLIGELPDSVIGHIVSFLPIREAIYTSLLSKRWINRWKFTTLLCVDDMDFFLSQMDFINFVDTVLGHWTNIHSFSLRISQEYEPHHIHRWISFVSNRRVKRISIFSWKIRNLSNLSCFECQTLEELELKCLRFSKRSCSITVPTFISLSSLTVLKLSGVKLTRQPFNESAELTLSLPVLKKYETEGCPYSGVKSVTLQVPLLEVISMDYGQQADSSPEIKFSACRLKDFYYCGPMLTRSILVDARVIFADVKLFNSENSMVETKVFVYELLSINAKRLKLCLPSRQALERAKHVVSDIPTFAMLRYLELAFVTGELLIGLLRKSPFLETLALKVEYFGEELPNCETVPYCILSTLKVVKFEKFAGDEHELRIAKFLMENSQVMERISFFCCPELRSWNKLEKVKEKLLSYKRSFSSTSIDFFAS